MTVYQAPKNANQLIESLAGVYADVLNHKIAESEANTAVNIANEITKIVTNQIAFSKMNKKDEILIPFINN